MAPDRNHITDIVLKTLNELGEDIGVDELKTADEKTRLFGTKSALDSINLISDTLTEQLDLKLRLNTFKIPTKSYVSKNLIQAQLSYKCKEKCPVFHDYKNRQLELEDTRLVEENEVYFRKHLFSDVYKPR